MTMQQRSTLIVLLGFFGLVLIHLFETDRRYTFGNAHAVDWAILIMFIVLGLTHAFIACVMWIQRSAWLPSEASMFRWISFKGMLWTDLAVMFRFNDSGVRIDIAYLYILMAVSTIDMDVKMAGRYLLRWEAKEAWDGTFERRNGPPGRRRGDRVA